jgi:transposase
VLSPRSASSRAWQTIGADLASAIEGVSADIVSLVEKDPACERLMTVPGIGPITSSVMVAAVGGDVLQGRDFAAWLGPVHDRSRPPHYFLTIARILPSKM